MALRGADDHAAGGGCSRHVRLGDDSDRPLTAESHDLLDAVPVGLGQGEAARSGP